MQKIEACLKRAAKSAPALSLGFLLSLGALCDVTPAVAAEGPGSIIRVWPLEGGAPGGGNAFRILYRSTGLSGQPIEVSGAIFIPPGAAPPGGRNVIAWAHPTSGVVEACAPSLMPDVWHDLGIGRHAAPGLCGGHHRLSGLGRAGHDPPYLIGVSEGRAVLDSVRAARDMPDAAASNRFAVWGHSQGGHASLYTGEIAASYAPDLKLVGVAAAAPATYLIELFDADKSSPGGKDLTAMTIYSWSRLLNDPATSLVTAAAMPAYERIARDCIESIAEFEAIDQATKPLAGEQFLKANPTEVEPWRSTMLKNTPGQAPAGAPVFLAQGTADTTVRPEITKQFGEHLCKQGTRVSFVELPGVTHTFAAKDSVHAALAWMGDRFRGAPAPSSCGR